MLECSQPLVTRILSHGILWGMGQGGLDKLLARIEILAALLAATIHDFEHRGFNNDFLIKTQDDWVRAPSPRAPEPRAPPLPFLLPSSLPPGCLLPCFPLALLLVV